MKTRRLHVVNETRYRTDDLRRFCLAGMRAEGVADLGGYTVKFIPARGQIHGRGSYGGRWVRLSIPRELSAEKIRDLARIFVHELGHNRGLLEHREMRDWWVIEVPWAEGLEFRLKEPKLAKPRDVQTERRARAQVMLAQHEAKLRREQKLVKKWCGKVRYYERVMEKRAASPPRD